MVVPATPVLAQSGSPVSAADASPDIVVTAQRRTERLQDVPIAVTAVSGDTLREQHITTASELAAIVPNLQAVGTVGGATPIYSLRGISMSDYSLNQASPVATYVDEVYKGNFALLGVSLFDLERIEVLRGPQGTLFGKNTTGGAVNLISRKPGFDPEGELSVGYGNYNRADISGAVQLPVTDSIALRGAFTYARADGTLRNRAPGQSDLDAVNEYGLRLSLLVRPASGVEVILRGSTSLQRPVNYGIIAQPGPAGIGGGVYDTFNALDPVTNPRRDDFRVGLGRRELTSDFTPRRRNRTDALSLTVSAELSPTLNLTSISSYDYGSLLSEEDTDGSALKALSIIYGDVVRQATQDVRLSTSGSAPLQFTLGGFYGHEDLRNATTLRAYQDVDFNFDGKLDFQDCLAAGPPAGCELRNNFRQRRDSWAVYGDANYALTSHVKLRAGIRYSADRARQDQFVSQLFGSDGTPLVNLIPGDPVNFDATTGQRLSDGNWSGRIGLDYSFSGNLAYLAYNRGYRASSFAAQAFFSPSDLNTARPETVDALEAGLKFRSPDRRLQINGAAFWYSYKNQQFIDVNPDGTQRLLNLPRSRIYGAEVELVARPVSSLALSASLGLLSTHIREGMVQGQNVRGNDLPNAPQVTLSYAADWTAIDGPSGIVRLRIDGSVVGSQHFDILNTPSLRQGSYHLLGARAGWRSPGDKFGIAIWGRNLTNAYYFTSRVAVSSFGFNYNHIGAPRTFGVTVDTRF